MLRNMIGNKKNKTKQEIINKINDVDARFTGCVILKTDISFNWTPNCDAVAEFIPRYKLNTAQTINLR